MYSADNTMGRAAGALRPGLGSRVESRWRLLLEGLERRRQRRTLATLPDHILSDIGVSRCEAMAEASKPFWRR